MSSLIQYIHQNEHKYDKKHQVPHMPPALRAHQVRHLLESRPDHALHVIKVNSQPRQDAVRLPSFISDPQCHLTENHTATPVRGQTSHGNATLLDASNTTEIEKLPKQLRARGF
eukprot:GHVU01214014.1.p1 GENE.GHVU01214014.1~~GHVU01214014.1.p1  ORF type:complete len:114 (-),score=0.60 GHVU01214014.1:353-694(-)